LVVVVVVVADGARRLGVLARSGDGGIESPHRLHLPGVEGHCLGALEGVTIGRQLHYLTGYALRKAV